MSRVQRFKIQTKRLLIYLDLLFISYYTFGFYLLFIDSNGNITENPLSMLILCLHVSHIIN